MLDELTEILNSDELYIKQYNISTETDLFDDKKINFYYLLFNYVLNNSFYIFQIDFLNKIRNNIKKIIKKNNEIYLKEENKDKLIFVLSKILDSDYYMNKYIKDINDQGPNQSKINTYSNSKGNLTTQLYTNYTNNQNYEIKGNINEDNYLKEAILSKSSFLFNNNEDGEFIFELYELDNEKIKEKNEIMKNLDENFEKFLNYLSTFKELIKKEFEHKYNLLIKLDFNQENSENNNNNFISNINCEYTFYPPNSYKLFSYKDDNILINGINSYSEGLFYLINKINDSIYKPISFNINVGIIKKINETKLFMNKEESENQRIFNLFNIGNLSGVSQYLIIEFMKIIGKHIGSAEFAISLSNGYFVSGGNCKELNIYNKKIEKRKTIDLSFYPNNISEIKNRKDIINILCSSNDNIRLITLEMNNDKEYYIYDLISSNNCVEIGDNNYMICNTKGVYLFNNLFKKEKNKPHKLINNSYKVIKKINKTIIAFTSNEVIPNGKNSLILFDLESKEIKKELNGYSFSKNINSLLVMNNTNLSDEDKILICACQQYKSNQKNGILLLSIFGNKIKDKIFYELNDFEPSCFCELLYVNNFGESYNTNYFLVGGFNKLQSKGGIQLYRINNNNIDNEITIEFIQDINLENNKNSFSGTITCIIQSKDTGNLIITCSDGSVNLFSPPNLNYYLFYSELEKKDFYYDETIYYDDIIKTKKIKYNINRLKNLIEKEFSKYKKLF